MIKRNLTFRTKTTEISTKIDFKLFVLLNLQVNIKGLKKLFDQIYRYL